MCWSSAVLQKTVPNQSCVNKKNLHGSIPGPGAQFLPSVFLLTLESEVWESKAPSCPYSYSYIGNLFQIDVKDIHKSFTNVSVPYAQGDISHAVFNGILLLETISF